MATKMTANGVSTTTTPGTEQYEVFYTGYGTRRNKALPVRLSPHRWGIVLLRGWYTQRVQTTP